MIDFTKAFDTVDLVILLHKLSQLSLPGFVINWICSFLSDSQQCKVNGLLSNVVDIGLSIVQGSGIDPTLYIAMKNDLCIVSAANDRKVKTMEKEVKTYNTRMWANANAQRDGRPVKYRWRPLFNAAKFG